MSDFNKRVACRYNTAKDLHDRLHSTFVMFQGKPIYVDEIQKNPVKIIGVYENGDSEKIVPDHPDLDISGFELGYINTTHQGNRLVVYASRGTAKHYKQGTCREHLSIEGIDGNPPGWGINWTGGPFWDLLNNRYPTLNTAKELLSQSRTQVAISKSVALKRIDVDVIMIYLRKKEVAWMTPDYSMTYVPDSNISWVVKKELAAHGLVADRRFF